MRRIPVLPIVCALLVAASAAAAQLATTGAGKIKSGGGGSSLTFTVPGSGNTCLATGVPSMPFTCSGMAIGPATSDRVVVVAIAEDASSPNGDILSVTVGGVSATKAADSYGVGSTSFATSVWYAAVSAGTTATVVFTTVGGSGWLNEGVITTGYLTGSVAASVSSTVTASPPSYPGSCTAGTCTNTGSVSVASGGVAVIAGVNSGSGTMFTSTWTNATSDLDTSDGSQVVGTVAHAASSASVTQSVHSAGTAGWVSASFQP